MHFTITPKVRKHVGDLRRSGICQCGVQEIATGWRHIPGTHQWVVALEPLDWLSSQTVDIHGEAVQTFSLAALSALVTFPSPRHSPLTTTT